MVAIKGWTWSETMLRQAENIPHTITPPPAACTVVTDMMGPCSYSVNAKF